MPERIQRKRTKGWRMPDSAVYVGRPTRWGNPHDWREWRENFPANLLWPEGPGLRDQWCRERAVEAYQEDWSEHIKKEPRALDRLRAALSGHDLACWCPKNHPCHADVLLELANAPPSPIAITDPEKSAESAFSSTNAAIHKADS